MVFAMVQDLGELVLGDSLHLGLPDAGKALELFLSSVLFLLYNVESLEVTVRYFSSYS